MIFFVSIFLEWLSEVQKTFCSHWVSEFRSRSCMYYWVKQSNVFCPRLLWSLFQVVTKCPNNYCFLKNMPPLQTLTNKTPACKYNLGKHSLAGITLDILDYNILLFWSDFKVSLNLFSLQKFSNSQFTTLKCFSRISIQGFQIHS